MPPDADVQDPAAIQLREAWERALMNADATDEGQEALMEGTVQMPVLEVGGTGETGTGGAGTAGSVEGTQATTQAPASNESATSTTGTTAQATGNTPQDVARLRAQLQALQAQQEESAASSELLQQQLTGMQARAEELERMRQERLAELERARTWMIAADQALEAGELAVGNALSEADSALAQVVQSASDAGSGQTVVLIEDARGFIAQALEATGHRDTYQARRYLVFADLQVREARRRNLDTPAANVVTP